MIRPAPTPPDRVAEAGRCACGQRVVRGTDQHGDLATTETWHADAASELLAYAQGRASYVLELGRPRALTLTRRSTRDLARKPSGFNRDRIVLAHRCPPRKDTA
jgi:hypothetical protein